MNHLILFDGDCNFCNRSVQFILKRDTQSLFSFASLQSDSGQKFKQRLGVPAHLDSMILICENKWYAKSSAALRIAKHLKGVWKLTYFFLLIPKPIRDFVYDIVAKNRHRLFKETSSCTLPKEGVKNRFL